MIWASYSQGSKPCFQIVFTQDLNGELPEEIGRVDALGSEVVLGLANDHLPLVFDSGISFLKDVNSEKSQIERHDVGTLTSSLCKLLHNRCIDVPFEISFITSDARNENVFGFGWPVSGRCLQIDYVSEGWERTLGFSNRCLHLWCGWHAHRACR